MTKSVKRAVEVGGSGRWTVKRNADAVMRLLRGEDLDTVSRQLKVTAATMSEWRNTFLARGLAGLKRREVEGRLTPESPARPGLRTAQSALSCHHPEWRHAPFLPSRVTGRQKCPSLELGALPGRNVEAGVQREAPARGRPGEIAFQSLKRGWHGQLLDAACSLPGHVGHDVPGQVMK